MSPTVLKMQPTIHFQSKFEYSPRPDLGLLCKRIMGCIFNSFGLILTSEIPCIIDYIQGVIEMRDQILTTRYWLHVELGKNI
jgi:hypothetical protein